MKNSTITKEECIEMMSLEFLLLKDNVLSLRRCKGCYCREESSNIRIQKELTDKGNGGRAGI